MIVHDDARGHGRAHRRGRADALDGARSARKRAMKRAALHPEQAARPSPRSERSSTISIHQTAWPMVRRSRRAAPPRCRRRDRDQRLQERRGEGQDDAAPPGLLIGDEIGRDHRLAVARAGGVKDPVGESESRTAPDRAAVGLRAADGAGEHAVEFGLLGEQPAGEAVGGRRRAARRAVARRRAFCASASSSAPSATARRPRRAAPRRRATAARSSRAFHRDLVGELRAEIARRRQVVEEGSRQGLPRRRVSPGRATVELAGCRARRRASPASFFGETEKSTK